MIIIIFDLCVAARVPTIRLRIDWMDDGNHESAHFTVSFGPCNTINNIKYNIDNHYIDVFDSFHTSIFFWSENDDDADAEIFL